MSNRRAGRLFAIGLLPLTAACSLLTGGGGALTDDGTLAPCPPAPHCVLTGASDPARHVDALLIEGSAEVAWTRLVQIVAALPRTTIVVQKGDYLHAQCRSTLGFVDDVEFVRDSAAGHIRVRSASQLGHYDFGVNRRRVEQIRAALASPSGA